MTSSESLQHRKIKETVCEKLKEWTGATLQEYQSSGHELDVFAVTPTGISIYVEIVWSSSRSNFFRDMTMIQSSDADVKLVVVSPKILNNDKYQREFKKVAISQRRLNFAMYGDFIDGERMLNEPDYIETEIKGIVLGLLKHVQIRGKAIRPRVQFEPPKPPSADEIGEHLLSNLFPVKKYPSTIFASPTSVRYIREVYGKLGREIEKHLFLPKNKKLYTFDNLRKPSSPFLPIISKDEITEEKVSDWICDANKRNDLMYLFNLALRKYCKNRGLHYDKKHDRFVCLLRNGRTNFFRWRPETRFITRRIAECVKGKEGNILYCRHYAASLRFMLLENVLFLKIEPTLTFTYDGYRSIRSPKLASLMSRYLSKQYNSEYLSLVRFWGKFLSRLDVTISIPVGERTIETSSSPIATPVSVGIAKEKGA